MHRGGESKEKLSLKLIFSFLVGLPGCPRLWRVLLGSWGWQSRWGVDQSCCHRWLAPGWPRLQSPACSQSCTLHWCQGLPGQSSPTPAWFDKSYHSLALSWDCKLCSQPGGWQIPRTIKCCGLQIIESVLQFHSEMSLYCIHSVVDNTLRILQHILLLLLLLWIYILNWCSTLPAHLTHKNVDIYLCKVTFLLWNTYMFVTNF